MALRGRDSIQRVGLIGGGVIGTGWAIRCLAHGLDVTMTDPAPGAEAATRENIAKLWPTMEQKGLSDGASPDRLTFVSSIGEAVGDADFVQENHRQRWVQREIRRPIRNPAQGCEERLY